MELVGKFMDLGYGLHFNGFYLKISFVCIGAWEKRLKNIEEKNTKDKTDSILI